MPTNPLLPKPKVLLVDLPVSCTKQLESSGYNVRAGSFGAPFRVKAADGLAVVAGEGAVLPNLSEQEVIFVDLSPPKAVSLSNPITSPPYAVMSLARTTFRTVPSDVFLLAGDALHLACTRHHGFTEVFSNDRHLLRAAVRFGITAKNVLPELLTSSAAP